MLFSIILRDNTTFIRTVTYVANSASNLNDIMETKSRPYLTLVGVIVLNILMHFKKGLLGVKEAIKFIKMKHSIALMVDQRVSEGEKIEFFNEKALTTTLPGQLSLKYNLDIVPIFIERNGDKFFKMKVYEPIKSSTFKDKIDVAQKLSHLIENMISKNPNQWIWTHNRWK